MINYNLEDFKSWLYQPRNQSLKDQYNNWEIILQTWSLNNKTWEKICQRVRNRQADEGGQVGTILQWMKEVDRQEQQNNMITFQEWLNNEYPNKAEVEEIKFPERRDFTESDLLIADFPSLKEVIICGNIKYLDTLEDADCFNIRKCKIKNCPKLEAISFLFCRMTKFTTDDLPNLTSLSLDYNNLTSLDISKYPNLTSLSYANNPNLQPPLQTLVQNIQQKEQELSSARERENQTKISNLEQEIQKLKDLKIRLETDFQQKESELLTELDQIKQQKIELENRLQSHQASLATTRQQLDQLKSKLVNQQKALDETRQAKEKFFEETTNQQERINSYQTEQNRLIKTLLLLSKKPRLINISKF